MKPERRRAKQMAFNEANGITPKALVKRVKDLIDGVYSEKGARSASEQLQIHSSNAAGRVLSEAELAKEIKRLEKEMLERAKNLEFEAAARIRDQLALLKQELFGA